MQEMRIFVELDLTFFDADESEAAGRTASERESAVYTWCSSGRSNWLSRGFHLADRLGYVILPTCLPDEIDVPDDAPEDGDELSVEDVDLLQRLARLVRPSAD